MRSKPRFSIPCLSNALNNTTKLPVALSCQLLTKTFVFHSKPQRWGSIRAHTLYPQPPVAYSDLVAGVEGAVKGVASAHTRGARVEQPAMWLLMADRELRVFNRKNVWLKFGHTFFLNLR